MPPMLKPPSTRMLWPVINDASGLLSQVTAPAISSLPDTPERRMRAERGANPAPSTCN
jgi:hypothetical protein